MNQEGRLRMSYERNCLRNLRITWFFELLAVLWLVWTVEPGLSQVASNQIPEQNPRARYLVSKNQLLTPEKALKEADRARQDLLRGRQESARKEIQRALDIFPDCAVALTLQGILSAHDKQYAEAARAFQRSIEEDPTLGAAYLGLGDVYTTQGRFQEALIPLDRASALLPGSWVTYFETALAHLGLGESTAVLKETAYAERFAGADGLKRSGAAYLRGVAYLQLNDLSAAKESLQEAVKRSPKSIYATLAEKRLDKLNPPADRIR